MARVVLINPPGLPETTANREGSAGLGALEAHEGGFRYPPHTLAAVAASLRVAGFDVTALDAAGQRLPARCEPPQSLQCLEQVSAARPDLIGVCVSWATREADRCSLALLRRAMPGIPLVAWGPGLCAAVLPHLCDHLANADYVLVGEPEGAFARLCTRLLSAKLPRVVTPALLDAPGYDAHGLLTDLDSLPYPAWDLLPVSYDFITVMSSRGCPATCRWCPYVVAQGRQFRARSPQSVVGELRELVQRYHPARIVFRDPVFAQDRARVVALCALILRDRVLSPGANLRWECESRPDDLDPALVRLMHLAGCIGIKLGLETVEADVLQSQGRVADGAAAQAYLARTEAVVAACRRHDVASRVFVMAGLPGQTAAGARATADYLVKLRPSALTIKQLQRYPGTALAEQEPTERAASPRDAGTTVPLSEVAGQLEPLYAAQKLLRGLVRRPAPRWRRMLTRASDRLWFAVNRGDV